MKLVAHYVNPLNIVEYIVVLFHPCDGFHRGLKFWTQLIGGCIVIYKVHQWKAHCHLRQHDLLDLWIPNIIVRKITSLFLSHMFLYSL